MESTEPAEPETGQSGARPQDPTGSDPADVLREAVSHLVDVHRSLEAAEACLPTLLDPRGMGDLLTMLTAVNEDMRSLMVTVRAGMGIPPELVDEDGLPENERASELVEVSEDMARAHSRDARDA